MPIALPTKLTHHQLGFQVNMIERTCTCGDWQVQGFPCTHAIAVITKGKLDISTLIDPCFFAGTYKKVYEETINSIPTIDQYEFIDLNSPSRVQTQNLKKVPGRPRQKRYRKPAEHRGKDQCVHGAIRKDSTLIQYLWTCSNTVGLPFLPKAISTLPSTNKLRHPGLRQ